MPLFNHFVSMFQVRPFISTTRTRAFRPTSPAPSFLRKMSLINVLQPHPEDRLHLRLHRARSVILTAQEFVRWFPLLVPLRLACAFSPVCCLRMQNVSCPRHSAAKFLLVSVDDSTFALPACLLPRYSPHLPIRIPSPTHLQHNLPIFLSSFSLSSHLQPTNPPLRLVEIRAAQRTFEGAYIRTALGQFSFALVVLKIFTAEFYSIGALFATYGVGILLVSLYRRYEGNRQFFSEVGEDGMGRKKFRTSGNAVVVLTALSVAAYISLIVLTVNLGD
jgi:hypothetical protein